MADERTPLIQVVRVAPPRERYSHSTVRRFCTIALACTLIVIVVLFLVPLRWLPSSGRPARSKPWDDQLPHQAWPGGVGLEYDELLEILMETPDPQKARDWSEYYTSGPHLAGKNLSQAVQTMEWWQDFGIHAEIVSYDVYINYPAGHELRLLEKEEDNFKTVFEATLEEDVLDDDPTTQLDDRVPTFHGYSASGNVTAKLVFVNFCTFYDFDDLVQAGVDLQGKVALCKYGRVFRGLKVKRAQELGMAGVILYDDPQEDGEMTQANGYKPYPDGPARNPSSVQRGSVQYLSIAPGDPTTPGYPSLPGAPRQNTSGAIPDIPSLPISYREALPLLKALNGHGPKASEFNEYWQGGGLEYKGVDYNIGPSEAYVNLVNEQDYVTTPLWNVIGVINGTIKDEVVVLGNHRDGKFASLLFRC
jgi:N-acetylated-alpha-linked acidic dipeptidase